MSSPDRSREGIEEHAIEQHPRSVQPSGEGAGRIGESMGEVSPRVSGAPQPSHSDVMATIFAALQAQAAAIERLNARMDQQMGQAAQPSVVPPPMPVVSTPPVHHRGVTLQDFQKMDPPKFYGESGEDPYVFLSEMKKLGKRLHCTDEQLLEFATYNLKGYADDWWTPEEEARERINQPLSWGEFEVMFVDRFMSEGLKLEKSMEYNRLRQGHMSVEEYNAEFNRLSKFVRDLQLPERARISRYVEGLNADLAFVLSTQLSEIPTLAKAMDKARSAGAIKRRMESAQSSRKKRSGSSSHGQPEESGSQVQDQRRQVEMREARPSVGYAESGRPSGYVCYYCHQPGHIKRNCPYLSNDGKQGMQPAGSHASVQMPLPPSSSGGRGGMSRAGGRGRGGRGQADGGQSSTGRGPARLYAMVGSGAQSANEMDTGISLYVVNVMRSACTV